MRILTILGRPSSRRFKSRVWLYAWSGVPLVNSIVHRDVHIVQCAILVLRWGRFWRIQKNYSIFFPISRHSIIIVHGWTIVLDDEIIVISSSFSSSWPFTWSPSLHGVWYWSWRIVTIWSTPTWLLRKLALIFFAYRTNFNVVSSSDWSSSL